MSDLLHFYSSHDALLRSFSQLLAKTPSARGYVAVGKYTALHGCETFLELGSRIGLDEGGVEHGEEASSRWMGTRAVAGLDMTQLAVRKSMCRWWVGRWQAEATQGTVDMIAVA